MRFLSALVAAAILSSSVAPALADTAMKASPKPTAHAMKSSHPMMKSTHAKSTTMKSSHMQSTHMKSSHMNSDHMQGHHMMKASPKPTSRPN